jgi:hypothetical protein
MQRARLAMMLLAAGTFASRARADALPFTWNGPECGTSAPLLERRLLELMEERDRERLSGSVAVTRNAGLYGVELSVALDGRPLGSRRFEAKSCAGTAETAAVAASLAVYEGEGPPPGAAESGVSPDIWTRRPDPVPDFARPAPAPQAAPELPLLLPKLGLFGQVELGVLPEPAWGGAISLELGVGRRWSFGVQGSMTGEQRQLRQEPAAVYLSSRSGMARVCLAPVVDEQYRIDGCAGARMTQTRGRGEGFDLDRSATLSFVAPLLAAGFSVRAPRMLEWRWELDGSLPLARRRFLVDGDEVARPDALVGALRLGVVLRFR